MSDQFIGEIRMFGGNFAPSGWQLCNGQLLSIANNSALFALIGTTYGGDGQTTFGLPNMQGRLPASEGSGPGLTTRVLGEMSGTENVTLTSGQLPAHNHSAFATTATGNVSSPSNSVVVATPGPDTLYAVPVGSPAPTQVALNSAAVGPTGGSQPHDNLMPSLCVSFIIALVGIFPSRN